MFYKNALEYTWVGYIYIDRSHFACFYLHCILATWWRYENPPLLGSADVGRVAVHKRTGTVVFSLLTAYPARRFALVSHFRHVVITQDITPGQSCHEMEI